MLLTVVTIAIQWCFGNITLCQFDLTWQVRIGVRRSVEANHKCSISRRHILYCKKPYTSYSDAHVTLLICELALTTSYPVHGNRELEPVPAIIVRKTKYSSTGLNQTFFLLFYYLFLKKIHLIGSIFKSLYQLQSAMVFVRAALCYRECIVKNKYTNK